MADADLASSYDYELPRELIAQHPLSQRTDARLLNLKRSAGELFHYHVRDLPKLLRAGDTLVLNDTRVIPARLAGYRTRTQGNWEGLFLRTSPDQPSVWEVMGKTRGKLVPGESISLRDRNAREGLTLVVVGRSPEGHLYARPDQDRPALELLEQFGRVPLPPYIRDGRMTDDDVETYQTVFARNAGAVAAPTAGLHFTTELMHLLGEAGVSMTSITLHVGIGTFRPLKTQRLSEHFMHAEWGQITESSAEKLRQTRAAGGRVIAVGTTSVRVLESVAAEGPIRSWSGETKLFIRPGHKFKAVDALITNFHLPRSTLLVLVSAFAGREATLEAYAAAVAEKYRFFSYGDAMFIE